MKKTRQNRIFALLLCVLTITLGVFCHVTVSAASPLSDGNGTYSVPVDLNGLTMGADHFSSAATVEKSGDRYYMSFGHSSSISQMRLELGKGAVGFTVKTENDWTIYTYTLSAAHLQERLSFTAYIKAMNKDVAFTVSLDLAHATKTSETIAEIGERPAEFVPVITTDAGEEYEAMRGSVFAIPSATAKIGEEDCDVAVTVYYLNHGVQEEVAVTEGRFVLENVGEYHLIYKASSSSFTTSLGNPTYTVLDILITSGLTATELAKFTDPDGIVPEGANLMASRVTSGTVFETVREKMAALSEDYTVFQVRMIDTDGSDVMLTGPIALYLQAKSTFDRTQIVVYHLSEDGTLTEVDCSGYGRYVKCDTDQLGTFIVCIPGITFRMPMWGYVLICCGVILLIAAALTAVIVVKKKKKKATPT